MATNLSTNYFSLFMSSTAGIKVQVCMVLIRFLTLCLILATFSSPALAFDAKGLKNVCSAYADNGFKLDGLSIKESNNASACVSFVGGVMQIGKVLCVNSNSGERGRKNYGIRSNASINIELVR